MGLVMCLLQCRWMLFDAVLAQVVLGVLAREFRRVE